ncbi:MAG: hypothetical protein P8Y09_01480 [Deltaproteobacteria bacterium]
MIEDEQIVKLLQEIGGMLGFASNGVAWSYLAFQLASQIWVNDGH